VAAIGIVGDYAPGNPTHTATDEALARVAPFEWVPTPEVDEARLSRYGGLLIAPGSPYRRMEGALRAIRFAQERGVPLVGT